MSMNITMAYAAITAASDMAAPHQKNLSFFAGQFETSAKFWANTPNELPLRRLHAIFDTTMRGLKTFDRRPFNIPNVVIGGKTYTVQEEVTSETAFMRAIKFYLVDLAGNKLERNVPKAMVVAPMSGHFATLLRGTVERLITDTDVTITDWKNARNIPVSAGRFDLNSYKNHLITLMQEMGRNTHAIGVCQPTVPLLAAIAQMAEDNDMAQPLSMTLIGGPIFPSANPTEPVNLSKKKDLQFFKDLTGDVPASFDGAGRTVYPGFMQLAGFISMNPTRHIDSHKEYFKHLTKGDEDSAQKHREFYDEYMAVMDMPAEFYVETIDKVFQSEALAYGKLVLDNRLIDLRKISQTALMTIEGELDDIAAKHQTSAAHMLTPQIPNNMKFAHLEKGAGHYGVFNGRRWRDNIAPRLIGMMHKVGMENGIQYDAAHTLRPTSWQEAQATDFTKYNIPTMNLAA